MKSSQHEFHSLQLQGQWHPEKFTHATELTNADQDLKNIRSEIWTAEINQQVKTIWERLSQQFAQRFGIISQQYQPEIFVVLRAQRSGRHLNYSHVASGTILLYDYVVQSPSLLETTLRHELGHFYARRRVMEEKNMVSGDTKYITIQQGIRRRWLGGQHGQRNVVFSTFDEALNELTTQELDHQARNLPFSWTQNIEDEAYKYDILIFKQLIKALHQANQVKTELDIYRLFQEVAWGKSPNTAWKEITQLAEVVYGKDVWQVLVHFTKSVTEGTIGDSHNKNAKRLWKVITSPLPKEATPEWSDITKIKVQGSPSVDLSKNHVSIDEI